MMGLLSNVNADAVLQIGAAMYELVSPDCDAGLRRPF